MSEINSTAELPQAAIERYQNWLRSELLKKISNDSLLHPSREKAQQYLEEIHQNSKARIPEAVKRQLFTAVLDHLYGYGPIQPLLDDPTISEIMVNGPNLVYVERKGRLEKTDVTFPSEKAILDLIEQIIQPLGRRIDKENPTVDGRLPDGSRVNAVIPPVAIDGPGITIRKFTKEKLRIADLVEFNSLTPFMGQFLEACVVARMNILVSGGTGSGKTTLLNILSSFIPEGERIVTIEDAAELQLHQEHVFRMEARPPDLDGKGEVTIRHLVRNALRMRPDRIIVGEVRGPEALDMLQAMNTGHDGSLTTLHANSPRDATSRLETLVLMAGLDIPLRTVREQIASAVDVIVQQTRLRDGSRKITSITEIVGMEGDTIVLNEIYHFKETGADSEGRVVGEFAPTGMRPMFDKRLEAAGFKLGAEFFGANLMFSRPQRRQRD